jgi:uncharacterized protein YraI
MEVNMTRPRFLVLSAILSVALPAGAIAQTAYTVKSANLRSGPSKDYPLVTRVPGGAELSVAGCLDDWTWCDVSVGDDRGWMYAGNLDYPYQNRRVVILSNGGYVGLPIVPFEAGPYWDTYYRGRPWYGRRSYWVGRPFVSHRVIGPSREFRSSGPRHTVIEPRGTRAARPEVHRAPERAHVAPSRPQAAPRPAPRPQSPPHSQKKSPHGG